MRFRVGDLEFNATVADGSQAPSAQTGALLRSLTIQFRAQKIAMHEQVLLEAQQRQLGGVFSLTEAGEPELEWRVRESTSTYIGTEPYGIHHHVWRIDQVERLACQRLIVGSIELEPYEYYEQGADVSGVRLTARAVVSEADLEGLSRLAGPTQVVRVGISDTPRGMLIEGYVWGEGPDGLAVALVCADIREPRVTLDGVHGWPSDDTVDDLVGTLRAKGLLDEQDLDALAERIRHRRHTQRRVSNINAWKLEDSQTN
jgi:hypothetical protein